MSEQLIIKTNEQQIEDQQHAEEMIKKADDALKDPNQQQQQEDQQQQEETPKLFAGKYKTIEELEKGYLELQKLSSRKGIQQQTKENEQTNEDNQTTKDAQSEAKEALENVGLDFDKYTDEILSDGVLSEDSYKELESKGFPKSVVDAYIEGQKAIAERTNQEIYGIVGGNEAYTEMLQWAAQNLSQEEIESFNAALETGNISQIKMAVRGLKATYVEANGNPPKQLIGGYASGEVDVFESWAQVTEAMKDPKYDKDPAYRAQIQAKLGRSKNLV